MTSVPPPPKRKRKIFLAVSGTLVLGLAIATAFYLTTPRLSREIKPHTFPTKTDDTVPPNPDFPSKTGRGENPPSNDNRVTRFANIDAPEEAPVDTEFSIQVSLTRDKLSGDTTIAQLSQNASSTAAGAVNFPCPEPCVVTAVLFAPGFNITSGTNIAEFLLTAERDPPPVPFNLKSSLGLYGVTTTLTADLWRQGAFIAKVKRPIAIGHASTGTVRPPPAPRNVVVPIQHREVADLTVRWEEIDFGNQHFCIATVDSQYPSGVASESCTPGAQIQAFLANRYDGVLKTSLRGVKPAGSPAASVGPRNVVSQMRGLGRELYEKFAPWKFKKALGDSRASSGAPLHTIQIYTNDPTLPWELMVPCDDPACGFLGVDYQIARWHISDQARNRGPQTILYEALEVLAPHYSGASYLPSQQQEIQALATMPGYQAAGGRLDDFRQAFEGSGGTILHFAGHGESDQGYQIRMEDAPADPTMLRGWRRGAPARLYFWNACDSGQEKTIAGFVDGWAPALLDSGAGGFIGGLWPLGDAAAARFAEQFYRALGAGLASSNGVPVAELVQSGRSRFQQTGDPTYLGYVFYGDVMLRIKP